MSSKTSDNIISTILILVVVVVIGKFTWNEYREDHPPTIELSLIGNIKIDKLNGIYYLNYTSNLDRINTKGQLPKSLDLNAIKTLMDSAADKRFGEIKVKRKCTDKLKEEYKKPSNVIGNYEVINCEVYGDYKTALKVYDRNLFVDGMIDYINDREDSYINLVER